MQSQSLSCVAGEGVVGTQSWLCMGSARAVDWLRDR